MIDGPAGGDEPAAGDPKLGRFAAAVAAADDPTLGRFAAAVAAADPQRPFRLGLLGGTFDPVHFGHLLLAQAAWEQNSLDGILFIPTAFPFYKSNRLTSPSAERLAMLGLAVADDARFAVSQVETGRSSPCYTVDTLQIIKQAGGDRLELFLVVGADALQDLPHWKDAQRIAALVPVLYARRPGSDDRSASQAAEAIGFRTVAIRQPFVEISSSALRARVADGLALSYLTPPAVVEYIEKHRLYRGQPA